MVINYFWSTGALFILLLSTGDWLHAAACYPVACISSHEIIMMQQENNGDRRLYVWDLYAKSISVSLLSIYYHPALVKVLPAGDGISFIEEEAICIKKFERRSAKRIEIDEPIYGIELINWLDNELKE